jgi:hypothetical protein
MRGCEALDLAREGIYFLHNSYFMHNYELTAEARLIMNGDH